MSASYVLPYSSLAPSARPFREQFALFSTLMRQTSWSCGTLQSLLTGEPILTLADCEPLKTTECCTVLKARLAGAKFKALWPYECVRLVLWAGGNVPPDGSAPVPVAFLNVDVNWPAVPASMLHIYLLSLLKVTPQDPESYFKECVSAVDAETELECLIAGLAPGTVIGTRDPANVLVQLTAPARAEEAAGETLPSRGLVRVDPKNASLLLKQRPACQPLKQRTILLPPDLPRRRDADAADYRPPLFVDDEVVPLQLPQQEPYFLLYTGPEPLEYLRRAVRAAERPRWLHYHLYVSKHFDGARQYLRGARVEGGVVLIKDIEHFFPRAIPDDEKFIMHGKNVFLGMLERGELLRIVATCASRADVDESLLNKWVSNETAKLSH